MLSSITSSVLRRRVVVTAIDDAIAALTVGLLVTSGRGYRNSVRATILRQVTEAVQDQ